MAGVTFDTENGGVTPSPKPEVVYDAHSSYFAAH